MLIIIILVVIGLFFLFRKSKKLKLNNLVCINGGVKSGKTTLAVYLAIKTHRKSLIRWKIKRYIYKILFFNKKFDEEMPLLYSNIPLRYEYYIPLSRDVLLHKKRLAYKSTCLISEASLVANAQEFKDLEVNEGLLSFCKLYAHLTKGGYCFVETQTMSDLHHQFKKNLNNYLYIYTCNKMIPFYLRFQVREMLYNYDNTSVQNTFDEDIEKSMLKLWCPKSVWRKFDCYTYSSLSDNLDYDCVLLSKNDIRNLDLKSKEIISFNKFKYLKINFKDENGGVKNE